MNGHSHGTAVPGLMMDVPLMISKILERAARWRGDTEIASRPHTATGKVSKRLLRESLRDYRLQTT